MLPQPPPDMFLRWEDGMSPSQYLKLQFHCKLQYHNRLLVPRKSDTYSYMLSRPKEHRSIHVHDCDQPMIRDMDVVEKDSYSYSDSDLGSVRNKLSSNSSSSSSLRLSGDFEDTTGQFNKRALQKMMKSGVCMAITVDDDADVLEYRCTGCHMIQRMEDNDTMCHFLQKPRIGALYLFCCQCSGLRKSAPN